jgi:hypothetical protein
VDTHHEPGLACPVCFNELGTALVEDGEVRRPRDGDATVCSHCTAFLAYVEELSFEGSKLGMKAIDKTAYEDLPEAHQASLMNIRRKLITSRAQGTEKQTAIMGAMAREIATLRQRMNTASCGCLYCNSGDGLNCARRRVWK